MHAVEIAIANKNLNEDFDPTTCTVKEDGNLICDTVDLEVEVSGQKPKPGGTIIIKDWKPISDTLDFGSGPKPIGKAVTQETKTTGNIPTGLFNLGDEYIINVDGIHEYHFFVLSTEGDKVNLIMERNITFTGTLATSEDTGKIEWSSRLDYLSAGGTNVSVGGGIDYGNDLGPITVMQFLKNATMGWSNIKNLSEEYTDEGGNYGTIILDSKARLPKYSEVISTGCSEASGSCPLWMVNYLDKSTTGSTISGIYGYWLASSYPSHTFFSQCVSDYIRSNNVSYNGYGARPVISVSKSALS